MLRSHLATLALTATLSICASAEAKAKIVLEKTTVAYRTVDGRQILADIYRPKGKEVRPVIVWLHGGALIIGNREAIVPEIRALAEERGYAIVSIDYRLAPETKLPEIASDVRAAFTWLKNDGARRFNLDLDRMVAAGNSAGGYLTLFSGYAVNPQPKALVVLYGYGRLSADWYTKPNLFPAYNKERLSAADAESQTDGTPISDDRLRKGKGGTIYLYYRQNGLWPMMVGGVSPPYVKATLAPFEPAKHVTRNYPPTFMMHGTQDEDVPFEESSIMAAEFEKNGVPYLFKAIKNGGHGFGGGDPIEVGAAYTAMREFLMLYLEPGAQTK